MDKMMVLELHRQGHSTFSYYGELGPEYTITVNGVQYLITETDELPLVEVVHGEQMAA